MILILFLSLFFVNVNTEQVVIGPRDHLFFDKVDCDEINAKVSLKFNSNNGKVSFFFVKQTVCNDQRLNPFSNFEYNVPLSVVAQDFFKGDLSGKITGGQYCYMVRSENLLLSTEITYDPIRIKCKESTVSRLIIIIVTISILMCGALLMLKFWRKLKECCFRSPAATNPNVKYQQQTNEEVIPSNSI